MRHFLKKRILSGAVAIMLSAALSGCARNETDDVIFYDKDNNSADEKVSITFFGYKADAMNLTATEAAMQSFMSENKNIDITYEGIKGSAYWDAFDKRDAAGVLDDVVMIRHDRVISMSAQGKLADLSDLPGIEHYSDDAKMQFTSADGSVYFLPTAISTYNLYINYDLLNANGQKVPENYAEFEACCDYFVRKGVVPIIANNFSSLPTVIVGRGLFDTYQRKDVESVLKSFNSDPALLAETLVPGIELVQEMIRRGWIDADEVKATGQTDDDLKLFAKGNRPFMISGGWATVRVKAMEPGFTYGVHPYPILDDGSVLSFQVDTCISINANSPHIEEAKKFVSYLIQPEVMWEYCNSQASNTPLKDERKPSEKTLEPSAEYLINERVVFGSEYRLDLSMDTALLECAKTLLNGGTAEEAKAVLLDVLSE